MTEFNVGDRVVFNEGYSMFGFDLRPGMLGTVVNVFNYADEDPDIFVAWDEDVGGHDCDGLAEYGHGLIVGPFYISVCNGEDDINDAFEYDESAFLQMIAESSAIL